MTIKDRVNDYVDDLKERGDKLDERIPMLFRRYPLVGTAVFVGGFLFGLLIAWVF